MINILQMAPSVYMYFGEEFLYLDKNLTDFCPEKFD